MSDMLTVVIVSPSVTTREAIFALSKGLSHTAPHSRYVCLPECAQLRTLLSRMKCL